MIWSGVISVSATTRRPGQMLVFRVVIRGLTAWSISDQKRVVARAGALQEPAARVTEHGFELSVEARTAEAAREKVEAAVQGIHSHTGVYLATEINP